MVGLPALTDATRRALTIAMTTAERADSTVIAPEHLLVALLLEPTKDAHAVLVRAGADPSRLAELSLRLLPTLKPVSSGVGSALTYSSSTKQAIIAAAFESQFDGEDVASPRHLLRALFQDSESAATCALQDVGVTLAALRKASVSGNQ